MKIKKANFIWKMIDDHWSNDAIKSTPFRLEIGGFDEEGVCNDSLVYFAKQLTCR